MCSVIRSSVGEGTDVGAIMVVVVAYESYERILKIARALSYKEVKGK